MRVLVWKNPRHHVYTYLYTRKTLIRFPLFPFFLLFCFCLFVRFTTLTLLLPMTHAHTAHKPSSDELVGDNGEQIIPSIATYFADINAKHCEKIELIDVLFKTVAPILIKLECIVLESNSGQFENMCLYYTFWENQLLELLIRYFC